MPSNQYGADELCLKCGHRKMSHMWNGLGPDSCIRCNGECRDNNSQMEEATDEEARDYFMSIQSWDAAERND